MADLPFSLPRFPALFASFFSRVQVPERANLATICRLFFFGAPLHVAGFIIPFIVDAIKLVFGAGSTAYSSKKVGDESFIAVGPFGDHRDASSAVVFEILAFRIKTSSPCVDPGEPFWRSVTFSMRAIERAFLTKASARARSARSKVIAWKKSFCATIADAFPHFFVGNVSERGQFAEAMTADVCELGHPLGYHGVTSMYIT